MATNYIDEVGLKDLFGDADIETAVAETSSNLAAIITATCAEIDAYVGVVSPIPPSSEAVLLLQSAAADLVRYRLYRDGASDQMRDKARDALAFLKSVAAGSVKLPGSFGDEPAIDDPDTPEDESAMSGSAGRDWQYLL